MVNLNIDIAVNGYSEVQRIIDELNLCYAKIESLNSELSDAIHNIKYTISSQQQDLH